MSVGVDQPSRIAGTLGFNYTSYFDVLALRTQTKDGPRTVELTVLVSVPEQILALAVTKDDDVISPVLRAWKVFERTDLGPEGEKAREELAQFMVGLDAQATKFVESRDRMRARMQARSDEKLTPLPQ